MSLSISREEYDRGLNEFKATGSCRMCGKHGDLELTTGNDGTLNVSMFGQYKTMHLHRLSFRLVDSPQ